MWCGLQKAISLVFVTLYVLSWITLKFGKLWFFKNFSWSFFVLLFFDEFSEFADGSSELLDLQYRKEHFRICLCHFFILFFLKVIKNHLKFWKFYFSTFFREFSFAVCLRLGFELKSARNLNGIMHSFNIPQ